MQDMHCHKHGVTHMLCVAPNKPSLSKQLCTTCCGYIRNMWLLIGGCPRKLPNCTKSMSCWTFCSASRAFFQHTHAPSHGLTLIGNLWYKMAQVTDPTHVMTPSGFLAQYGTLDNLLTGIHRNATLHNTHLTPCPDHASYACSQPPKQQAGTQQPRDDLHCNLPP
jgi:hypothetical protein